MNLPRHVYHLAEAANWPSIEKHGLLPATELITRAGLSGADRQQLERSQRPGHTVLPGGVEIRDQRPMPAAALSACLVDLDPADWYVLINARVFFWLNPARLNLHRAAYASRPQVVLTLDAAHLVADYGDRAAVSPINSGNARRRPARRGAATFVPYAEWVRSGWASEAAALGTRERSRSHPPAELTITGAIPDAMRYVIATSRLAADKQFEER
ncbi:hypothetical protein SAMN05216276_102840 [Streptosporangium subroseum]|uniref:Uncharacterized protein n=1 Tax=Streptosporangium subroseum TaxID=106412 RepID=A0A239KQW9_9ACTN|nr:hypothetical protein [Streptosporangium subroseum]SNT19939.1 hypothetical protein SAMN05216276_102840 [Streptosporangium subroseum]